MSNEGSVAAPQSEELLHITADIDVENRPSDRQSRAMYFTKTVIFTTPAPENVTETNQTGTVVPSNVTSVNITEIVHPSLQWTPVDTEVKNVTNNNATAVSYTNATEMQNETFAVIKKNLTRLDYMKDDAIEGVAESRIVTEKPLSLETTFLQTRIPPNVESSRRVIDHDDGGMDTGVIAGIAFAGVVLAALAGSVAFVMYRRRYLNKPQTLNDKCSNPDSSGYLDDSTIRVS